MTRIGKKKQLLLALALSSCLATSAFAAAVPKAESIVTRDSITLGDVFSGVTENAGHYLAPAPQPGKAVTLGAYDLQRISDAFRLGWTPAGSVQQVVIRRSSNEIDRFDVQAALEKAMREKMGDRRFDVEIASAASFSIPEGADKALNVESLDYDAATGSVRAVVSAAAAPGVKKTVSGHYYAVSSIPVLRAPLRPGDVISEADLDYVDMRSTDISSAMATSADKLIGRTPRRGVPAMKPLSMTDVQMPLLVRKGDIVTMVLQNSMLSLTAQGRALENGAEGEAIRVMNASSKQVIDAVVTGTQKVDIRLPGAL
jgi:flagella basal body P-ring formation protein FlgA